MNLNLLWRGLALFGVCTLVAAQEKPFYLKDGDRVVFYGDSITDQRLYTTFTETYVVTRFPAMKVDFTHSGWGGDRVTGGGGGPIKVRLERDVIAYKPTVMTIMLGMNDGSYRAFDSGIYDQYSTGYEQILKSVKQALPNLRLTLIQPSPFDDVTQSPRFEGGYNAVLVRYGEFIKQLGERDHDLVADLNGPVVEALNKAKSKDAELAKKIIPDRVHPGPGGHLLMAGALLRAWNAPSRVSSVEIDAQKGAATKAEGTSVTDVKGGATVSWTELDQALPMPIDMKDAVVALAVNSSDFVESLDQQPLKVTGLSAAKYKLSVDGDQVGEFTKEELANGVNLALLSTPMAKQAAEVHRLTLQHNNLHFTRWRQIQVPLAAYKSDHMQSATKDLMAALDEEEAAVVTQQRAAAKPVSHRFELSPE